MDPTQEEMDVVIADIQAACWKDDGMAPVGAAADIINYLKRGDFVKAKYKAKIDRDKFSCCDRNTLAVIKKHFGCMLHGEHDCEECLKYYRTND